MKKLQSAKSLAHGVTAVLSVYSKKERVIFLKLLSIITPTPIPIKRREILFYSIPFPLPSR
jgi:hypothetical protein